jgi:hypothetical protein
MKKLILLSLIATIFSVACSNTRPDRSVKSAGLSYRELIVKDYDEMYEMVKKHTNAAHKAIRASDTNTEWEADAKRELIHAERVILSRPNSDNMVSKLVPEVRREVILFANYDDILDAMTTEAIQAFDPSMHLSTEMETTYLFMTENLISELKPEIVNDERARALMERIRDAKIDVPHDVMAERKLQGMFLTESPSDYAKQILDDAGFGKKRKKK